MKTRLLISSVLLWTLVAAVPAQAVVFSDDFEGLTPKCLPDSSKWDSSFATGYPGTDWLVVEGGLGVGGSDALVIKRVDPSLGQAKALFAPVLSGIVEVSLSYTEAAPNPGILNFMFDWDGAGSLVMESATFPASGDTPVLHYNIGGGHVPFTAVGGGHLVYNGGAGGQIWNTAKYTIDLDNDTLVAELNGVVSTPISVDFGANGFENFWVRGWAYGQAAIVDDVLITPEPVTLSLFALGGLLLKRRHA